MSFKLGKKNITNVKQKPVIKTQNNLSNHTSTPFNKPFNTPFNTPEDHLVVNKLATECNLADVKLEYNKSNKISIIPIFVDEKTLKLIVIRYENNHINFPITINDIKQTLSLKSKINEIIITNPNFNILPKKEKNSKIPKIIFQTYNNKSVTQNKWLSIETIKYTNPNYKYIYFNDTECINFIEKHFNESVVNAYNKLIPGAYKADLFRYCYLYINGGIYIDCKMITNINFDDLLEDNELIIVKDNGERKFYNAFICAIPKLELFMNCINNVVKNVETKFYGNNFLVPTGPRLFYDNAINDLNNIKHIILSFKNSHYLHNNKNDIIIYRNYPNYYEENSYRNSYRHYGPLWISKNIYK